MDDALYERLDQPRDSEDLRDALRTLARSLEGGAPLRPPWGERLRRWQVRDRAQAGWIGLALAALDGRVQPPHRLRLFRALWAEDEDPELQQRAAELFRGIDPLAYYRQVLDDTLSDTLDPDDLWYARRIVGQVSEEMCRDYRERHP